MAAILTFALVAPLGAMGSLAVGERRGGWDRPGRSAILGLVAACLGLDRTEEARHAALSAGLGLAVRREGAVTALLSDYHTAQTAPARKNRVFATRREELSGHPETMLSRRDYRADIAFCVALWQRPSSRTEESKIWSLEALAEAIAAPRFVPYLGRKSCPLGLPLTPRIVEADTVREGFVARDAGASRLEREALGGRGGGRGEIGSGGMVWADRAGKDEPALGLTVRQQEERRDEPINRSRWQFGMRTEIAADWPEAVR